MCDEDMDVWVPGRPIMFDLNVNQTDFIFRFLTIKSTELIFIGNDSVASSPHCGDSSEWDSNARASRARNDQ